MKQATIIAAVGACLVAAACGGGPEVPDVATLDVPDVATLDVPDVATLDTADVVPSVLPVRVSVWLDGDPAPGVLVVQGGRQETWTTTADGTVDVDVDMTVTGDIALMASHPEARTGAALVYDWTDAVDIELTRFDTSDNPDYVFKAPGEPDHSPSTEYCGHCHVTIVKRWFGSAHRRAASNPVLQDLYAGAAASLNDEATCVGAGGKWLEGSLPGSAETGSRCYIGEGVLPALNPGCGDGPPCDGVATEFGGCADCHAPGIDGALGGRDLLEATDHAYDDGIHCEVCHHVESIDEEGLPGVAGRLKIVRPSEPSTSAFLGEWVPLLFGPDPDVPNPLMGMVRREHFRQSRFCGGCHELLQDVLVPGASADASRWPSGQLPIHSTLSEWQASLYVEGLTCQGCHMPTEPDVANTADLQLFEGTDGVAGGWVRPPGNTQNHGWMGPASAGADFKTGALTLSLTSTHEGDVLTVQATVANYYAGHAFPTGEPMRSVLLLVEATCGGAPLAASGGDAVPDFGGYLAKKKVGESWTTWSGAQVGHVVRVIARNGAYHDYTGYGRFGDGSFDAKAKGMPVELAVGEVKVVGVEGDEVTLDGPLPDGDVAYLVGSGGQEHAGAPGFGFARVLVGPDGARMVPHFLAVDVASDNRLLPTASATSEHEFVATCDTPKVVGRLIYRPRPLRLARERGWPVADSVITEASP